MSEQHQVELVPEAEIAAVMREIQDHICNFLVKNFGQTYHEDRWDYAPKGEGGGITRVWENDITDGAEMGDKLLEKGGVNFSAIHGPDLPKPALAQISALFKNAPPTQGDKPLSAPFFATGISLVLHPFNPHVPTIHMNVRYFQVTIPDHTAPNGKKVTWWFGGGIDLTPYYPKIEQVIGFHQGLAQVCARHGEDFNIHKSVCDTYFTITHRKEMRGVGGIFFDHMHHKSPREILAFIRDLGLSFTDLYAPFALNNRTLPYTPRQRNFQMIRRGRYVEFNLCYDRGTKFGLESEGRTESILMSLPVTAKWRYNWQPDEDGPEKEISSWYYQPQDYVALDLKKFAAEHPALASL
jgi:coproporphyrinogen III oxidase